MNIAIAELGFAFGYSKKLNCFLLVFFLLFSPSPEIFTLTLIILTSFFYDNLHSSVTYPYNATHTYTHTHKHIAPLQTFTPQNLRERVPSSFGRGRVRVCVCVCVCVCLCVCVCVWWAEYVNRVGCG